MSNVYIKTKVRSGHDAMDYLRGMADRKIWIICDGFMTKSGSINFVTDVLDSSNTVKIFDQVTPDPTTEVVGAGLNLLCQTPPDILIGFGGGSAIDTAKGILYIANEKRLFPKPEFITIPTTSGTGSEVTSVAVITDTDNRSKHLVASDEILADVALLDPRLTLSVPPAVTANTGMDVLTHALEAYVAAGANSFSDALSEKALELVVKALLTCYRDGSNLEYRTQMHEASTLAGMAFNTAGLGVNHSIAHQLGGTFHIPHGLANAMLLNLVIDYNCVNPDVRNKYGKLACKIGLAGNGETPQTAVAGLKELIRTMMGYMEMPYCVSRLGIGWEDYEKQIQNMTNYALMDNCMRTTPRKIGTEEIRGILTAVYDQGGI